VTMRRPSDHSSRFERGELADPETLERELAHDEDETLRRRDFLSRTAAAAGGVALASYLPADELIAEAARRSARRRLPGPKNLPIDTFVVLMMENRSFDHYFGWHPDADAKAKGLTYPDAQGNEIETYRLTPDFQGCGHPDPDHGWTGGRWQWHGGKNDRFVTGNEDLTSSDEFAIGYYLKKDLPFIPHAADAYTLYDRWFCSIMASTYPNRHYQWGAQNGGQKSNEFPFEVPGMETGFTWETIADRAIANGVSFRYYNSDLPFSSLYGQRGVRWTRPIQQFYADALAGQLPQIAFVDPPFLNGGGGDGLSADEHPTATSALVRPSWPTSPMPSSIRPNTSAGRCSSTTTSGAVSSTMSRRRLSPTSAATEGTSTMIGASRAFASRASASRRSRGAGVSATCRSHTSRS